MRSATLVLVCFLMIGVPVYGDSHDSVASDVIALAKAQWAADIAKDADKSATFLADDYTEFNPGYPTRIDGKQLNTTFYKATNQGASKFLVMDMANPKVQVYGDAAILSYNFVGSMLKADGEVEPFLAKSTRVYAKIDGDWKLVHANFAAVD